MMRTLLLSLLLTTATFHGIFAQTGTISGSVQTFDGKAASMVNIGLEGTTKGTITDANGRYVITGVQEGSYTLMASFVGLQTNTTRVIVSDGKNTEVPTIVMEEIQERLQEVIVEGKNGGNFIADIPSHSLRLKGPLIELPQNIQVITSDVIASQQAIDMLENVSRNVSGAQMIEHWGNFARLNMRGFKLPAFRNGMNVELPWGPLAEDMSIVDRIEFVKGPAGFMLSSGEPGGLYNVVTKKPSRNQHNEVTLTTGSYNTLRSTVDIGGKLNHKGNVLYRLNLMGLTKESHRDYEFNNRYTIAPAISYHLDDKTTLTAEYIYQYSQMSLVGAAYVFSPNGFADLPRDFTLAEPNIDPTDLSEHNVFLNLSHKINDRWDLTSQLAYIRYKQEGSSLWVNDVAPNGDIVRSLSSFDAIGLQKLGQVFLNGDVQTGQVHHAILVGLDMAHKDYYADWWQTGVLGRNIPFNIYNPTYGVPADSLPKFNRDQSIRKRATMGAYPAIIGERYSSVYLQDELGLLNDKIRLTLAGRYTTFNSTSYGLTTDDNVFTPRVSLSVTVAKNTSIYGVYDQAFIPQTGNDKEGNIFVPERGNNLEVGLKRDWADGRWRSTIAVYKITKENVLVGDSADPNFQIQLGEVQSEGIEFDIQGEIIDGLKLILNYANTKAEVTDDVIENRIGTRIAGHAKHMTNGWVSYRFGDNSFLRGFGLALGYQYQVDRSSWAWNADNSAEMPDYFRLDGSVSWQMDNLSIGLNINNLLDDYLYSGSSYATYYYWQAEPGTNFRLNIGFKF